VGPEISLKTCFDSCAPVGHGAQGLLLRGWIVAPFAIRAICFRWPDGSVATAVCGVPRPDLPAAFPDEPHALHGGFWALDPRLDHLHDAELAVSDVAGRWWQAPSPNTLSDVRILAAAEANPAEAGRWESALHDARKPLHAEVSGLWRRTLED